MAVYGICIVLGVVQWVTAMQTFTSPLFNTYNIQLRRKMFIQHPDMQHAYESSNSPLLNDNFNFHIFTKMNFA